MSQEIVDQEVELEEEINEEAEEELDISLEDDEPEVEQIDWEARAKKAEQLLVKHKRQVKQSKPEEKADTLSDEAIEKKILKAQGVSEELLTQLTKIARVNGTSVIDAQSDPYFIAYKEKLEQDKLQNKAKLGASKGSGTVKKSKGFETAGLTDEEHKQLWRERQGL